MAEQEFYRCCDCGNLTVNIDTGTRLSFCDKCQKRNHLSFEEMVKELEADGVDVKGFVRNMFFSIERIKRQLEKIQKVGDNGERRPVCPK